MLGRLGGVLSREYERCVEGGLEALWWCRCMQGPAYVWREVGGGEAPQVSLQCRRPMDARRGQERRHEKTLSRSHHPSWHPHGAAPFKRTPALSAEESPKGCDVYGKGRRPAVGSGPALGSRLTAAVDCGGRQRAVPKPCSVRGGATVPPFALFLVL